MPGECCVRRPPLCEQRQYQRLHVADLARRPTCRCLAAIAAAVRSNGSTRRPRISSMAISKASSSRSRPQPHPRRLKRISKIVMVVFQTDAGSCAPNPALDDGFDSDAHHYRQDVGTMRMIKCSRLRRLTTPSDVLFEPNTPKPAKPEPNRLMQTHSPLGRRGNDPPIHIRPNLPAHCGCRGKEPRGFSHFGAVIIPSRVFDRHQILLTTRHDSVHKRLKRRPGNCQVFFSARSERHRAGFRIPALRCSDRAVLHRRWSDRFVDRPCKSPLRTPGGSCWGAKCTGGAEPGLAGGNTRCLGRFALKQFGFSFV